MGEIRILPDRKGTRRLVLKPRLDEKGTCDVWLERLGRDAAGTAKWDHIWHWWGVPEADLREPEQAMVHILASRVLRENDGLQPVLDLLEEYCRCGSCMACQAKGHLSGVMDGNEQ